MEGKTKSVLIAGSLLITRQLQMRGTTVTLFGKRSCNKNIRRVNAPTFNLLILIGD